ncbi:hypothetical protein ACNFJ7_03830 [Sphingomonas sp. HT-1]|uniref:hypothetical protein n=1 Tax=unclassified Sphingomonas TaxID=196159 RepID=UPI000306DA6F|nr:MULTISPECIES: hypothetical protein [unclassified Sphingomonas]KTF69255.1 hypothetical protein ATB93_10365 [Sphingomonas sp. WG]
MRIIDWIWRVRGSIPLASPRSSAELFGRLEGLFQERGTTTEIVDGALIFHKENPDSQDKLASFETGRLTLSGGSAPALHYAMSSKPLLWCFIAPLPFLAVALGVPSLKISGYSFAGIFVLLYIAGRFIEQRQAHRLFTRALGDAAAIAAPAAASAEAGVPI